MYTGGVRFRYPNIEYGGIARAIILVVLYQSGLGLTWQVPLDIGTVGGIAAKESTIADPPEIFISGGCRGVVDL